MPKQYYGIGKVVYGCFKDHAVFVNDKKTYLIIGNGGDKYTDPNVEEVFSPDTIQGYKLLSQSEVSADSSGVIDATFWLGIGAGLLVSQLGKHTEYLVEVTYKTGEKSHIVLIQEGYQILIGSMSIGAPETKSVQRQIDAKARIRASTIKDLSGQLTTLNQCIHDIERVEPSTIASELRTDINEQISSIQKELSKLERVTDAQLSYYSTQGITKTTSKLKERTRAISAAYASYAQEYKDNLSRLHQLQSERDDLDRRKDAIDIKRGKDFKKTSKWLFIFLIISVANSAFWIKIWKDDVATYAKYSFYQGPDAGTRIFTFLSLVISFVVLCALISSISKAASMRKASTKEDNNNLKANKGKRRNSFFNAGSGCN